MPFRAVLHHTDQKGPNIMHPSLTTYLLPIDLIFPLQQQQAPPINSISTAAVTSTNSISPNPTAATATLPDQKQIQGKMSCQKQPNGFSTFHVTFVRLPTGYPKSK